MAAVGEHRDAWGNTTEGCEVHVGHRGHGTWTLCGKPPVGVAAYGNGNEGRVCVGHRSGALRKTTFYADEVCELRTLDGVKTHELVRTAGRKGSLVEATT